MKSLNFVNINKKFSNKNDLIMICDIIDDKKKIGSLKLINRKLDININKINYNNYYNIIIKEFVIFISDKYKQTNNLFLILSKDNILLNDICYKNENIRFIKIIYNPSQNKEYKLYTIISSKFIKSKSDNLGINNKNTYIVKSKYLDKTFVDNEMNKKNKWIDYEKIHTKKNPDYIHIDQHFKSDKSLWKYKTKLKSQINITDDMNNIDNKYKLINILTKQKLNDKDSKKLKGMLLDQYLINLYDIFYNNIKIDKFKKLFNNGKVWIFKFLYSTGGENIVIINNFDNFKIYIQNVIEANKIKWQKLNIKKYDKMSKWTKSYYFIEWVLQEYITKPLLYENKKFHLRGYYIYVRNNNFKKNDKEGYILNNHRIFTAKNEFKNSDYLNKDIHDTHMSSTSKYINFKPDISNLIGITQTTKIEKDIHFLFKNILNVTNTLCYNEDKSCYHIFASDIIITNDYKIKLIEINGSAGLPYFNDDIRKINHPTKIFKNILKLIVEPKFSVKSKLKSKSKSKSKSKLKSKLKSKSKSKLKSRYNFIKI